MIAIFRICTITIGCFVACGTLVLGPPATAQDAGDVDLGPGGLEAEADGTGKTDSADTEQPTGPAIRISSNADVAVKGDRFDHVLEFIPGARRIKVQLLIDQRIVVFDRNGEPTDTKIEFTTVLPEALRQKCKKRKGPEKGWMCEFTLHPDQGEPFSESISITIDQAVDYGLRGELTTQIRYRSGGSVTRRSVSTEVYSAEPQLRFIRIIPREGSNKEIPARGILHHGDRFFVAARWMDERIPARWMDPTNLPKVAVGSGDGDFQMFRLDWQALSSNQPRNILVTRDLRLVQRSNGDDTSIAVEKGRQLLAVFERADEGIEVEKPITVGGVR